MIEKEHMLHTLHEVAPSPPLFSLSLLSSNDDNDFSLCCLQEEEIKRHISFQQTE